MLSFDRGKPFAVAVNSSGKKVLTIYTRPDTIKAGVPAEPDIQIDNPVDLIKGEDVEMLKKSLKLGKIEIALIKKFLKETGSKSPDQMEKEKGKLSAKLRRAIDLLLETVDDKLKKELDLSITGDDLEFLPLIGKSKDFDRSFYVVGPSESGKSYFIKTVCKQDAKRRPVVIFSGVEEDESLDDLMELKAKEDKKERLIRVPLLAPDDTLNLPIEADLKNTICVFDDIDSLAPYDFAEYLRQYRDNLLQRGRHQKISVMSTSHQLNNYSKTKQLLCQAEYVVLFPASNKAQSMKFMMIDMGLSRKDAEFMVKKATKHGGRFLAIKRSAPQLIMTNKFIKLLS